ncbi:hypothetical protein GWI33_019056 [Rhynchophorus ferrugineus]|uniref:Cytochrome P450 n=1 Tax=Rhynchophorus ferrugineus TaxID=354439 RepID=A0A834HWQ4_RHYFE|nr:hypothetical protein GWI33_019056 [Rhynchophorus ferrugineus]
MTLLVLVAVAGFLYLLNQILRYYKTSRILSKVPSPPGHWLIGNMDIILKINPDDFFDLLRDFSKKYGSIYRLSTPYITTINISDPGDLEMILSQPKHMSKSKVYGFLQNWLGEGLLTSSGLKWQKRRKILTRAFHFNILRQFLDVFNDETDKLTQQIRDMNNENTVPAYIDVVPLISHMTLKAMGETSMGMKNITDTEVVLYRQSIHKMGKLLLERIGSPLTRLSFIYRLTRNGREENRTIHQLHQFTDTIIKQREKQILNLDRLELASSLYSERKLMRMLDLLLLAKIDDNSIDYEGIREEVDTFMFEGHDTTAVALSFLLHSLASHVHIQDEVRRELREVLGDKPHPTYADLHRLEYTERVIKESLRLYPSVPFISRIASEDILTSTGYFLPKGTVLHMHIFDLHRSSEIYPDPLKFDPDRFLLDNCSQRHPFAYLPFSAGPRNCIGQKFALLELKSCLCGVLRKYRLEHDGKNEFRFAADLVLRTKDAIKIKFLPLSKVKLERTVQNENLIAT